VLLNMVTQLPDTRYFPSKFMVCAVIVAVCGFCSIYENIAIFFMME
jgi:hypothetical protein